MEQKEKQIPEIISWTVDPNGNATFLIFVPSEHIGEPHVLDLNKMTTACLEQAKAADPTINYVPEREFIIGWAVQLGMLVPSPVGPVDLNGNVVKDWKGIQYHTDLKADTHLLHGECKGDLNGLLELTGVNIGIERVVTHIVQP